MSASRTLGELGYTTSITGEPSFMGFGSENGSEGPRRFYGKYRGMVVQNVDPQRRGRLQVQVPDVFGPALSSWAMPCLPFAGFQMGMYIVPPPNAGVWVEFEQGNPDYPIWTGFYWGSPAEIPAGAQPTAPALPVLVLETPGTKSGMTLSETSVPLLPKGGVLLKSGTSSIAISAESITLTAAQINVIGVTDINGGALKVT